MAIEYDHNDIRSQYSLRIIAESIAKGAREVSFGKPVPEDVLQSQLDKLVSEYSRDTHFVAGMGFDSLQHVEVLMTIEEMFRIKTSEDFRLLSTIGSVLDYVHENVPDDWQPDN